MKTLILTLLSILLMNAMSAEKYALSIAISKYPKEAKSKKVTSFWSELHCSLDAELIEKSLIAQDFKKKNERGLLHQCEFSF